MALKFANGLGAYKVQHVGLRETIPSKEEIYTLMNQVDVYVS